MARTERSRVDFNINIKGVQDAQVLVKTLPKLIKQFDQLAAAMDKVEKAKGVSSTGKTKADAADRISRIELGVRKGDINNVKQLTANYASLVNQINALERAGAKTGAVQLRAYKMHQRLSDVINKRNAETRQLIRTQMDAAGSTDRMRGSLLDQMGSIKLSTQSLNQASQAVTQNAMATKNASFLLLNAGYLIQDSPYGIRGMANNVSQLAQAYQMLSQRIQFLNASQGTNLTVWKSLGSLLKGSTGIILLIGSVLPAALELVSSNWDEWFGTTKEQNEALENSISILSDYIGLVNELTKSVGSDPLSVIDTKSQVESLSNFEEELSAITELEEKLKDLRGERDALSEQRAPLLFSGTDESKDLLKDIEDTEKALKGAKEQAGALANVPLEKLTEKIENMRVDLAVSEELISRNPLLQLEQNVSQYAEALQKGLELYSNELVSDEQRNEARREVVSYISELEIMFQEAFQNADYDKAAIYNEYIKQLKEAIDEGSGDEELEIELPEINFDLPGNQAKLDQLSLDLFREQIVEEDAFRVADKITSINAQMQIELERVNEEDFDSFQAYTLAKEEVFREYVQRLRELMDRRKMTELQIQADLQKRGLDNPSSYQQHLENIKSYYNLRRQIVKESVDDEIEQKKRLAEVDAEEKDQILSAEQTLQDRKQQLISNWASFAVTTTQAVGQAIDEHSRAQFQIQKVASAAQAIINARLAFTKTIGQGGILATPLAYSALGMGLAQAAAILTQSYDSASATGRAGAGAGGTLSYRGLNFDPYSTQPFTGFEPSNSSSSTSSGNESMEKGSRTIRIVDGFGNLVMRGQEEIDRQGGLNYVRG